MNPAASLSFHACVVNGVNALHERLEHRRHAAHQRRAAEDDRVGAVEQRQHLRVVPAARGDVLGPDLDEMRPGARHPPRPGGEVFGQHPDVPVHRVEEHRHRGHRYVLRTVDVLDRHRCSPLPFVGESRVPGHHGPRTARHQRRTSARSDR
ncbi:hypothetical protein SCATT_25060 [Streptantibioticus cattleyicolor NRRL 8057 = DSM 46488]|uniref:Uncharacterized protein n=1 Tax=Streptantibioticus cattleyicolor (strain ATCC 35852 / DSM 46488 / JCM 4925 / NBRC 14057 / NRRL 8057) TaxID=1003195 RepID=G8WU55_STREN|nr:hypothetical protein SCATT_25060 [Streptantibioticus cattleyicolor NRRL 8057 = DSM 46488]